MQDGRAEPTVGVPPHQDPNADNEWDEDIFVEEFESTWDYDEAQAAGNQP